MLGHELAVEQAEIADLQPGDEPCQCNLRRIGPTAEHAFAEKGSPELHAVKTADEAIALPYLDRIGMAGTVKCDHRTLQLGIDPGLFAVCAGCDHAREIAIVGHQEPSRAKCPAKRTRKMESTKRNDRPVPGLDPKQLVRLAAVGHRKNSGGIAVEQQTRVETTHKRTTMVVTGYPALCPAAGRGALPWASRRWVARSVPGA